nr:nucleotidyltransferase family protein [Lachnospiraceae bacterium]
ITFVAAFLSHIVCVFIEERAGLGSGNYDLILKIIIRLTVCVLIPNVLYLLFYFKTNEFKLILQKIKYLKNVRNNRVKKKTSALSASEKNLLSSLRMALTSQKPQKLKKCKSELINEASSHAVVPLLYDVIDKEDSEEKPSIDILQRETDKTVWQSYHLLFESARLCNCLKDSGIKCAILKGCAAASFYPVPEYRKSGDIDILLCEPTESDRAVEVLSKMGYKVSEEQLALHQIVMSSKTGIEAELHIMLSEPFDNSKINNYLNGLLKDISDHIIYKEIMGISVPILDDDYQAYELLLHMLQHFLRRGFGLKLLCDWVVYWNEKTKDEIPGFITRYKQLIKESEIGGFSDMISSVCYHYLGLSEKAVLALLVKRKTPVSKEDANLFIREVLDGGEFGDKDEWRMVMLRGKGIGALVIEFHHQMNLNFPKAGKIFLLWPVLWTLTLIKFLRNNRKLRGKSSLKIIKKTGERSALMEKINIWK